MVFIEFLKEIMALGNGPRLGLLWTMGPKCSIILPILTGEYYQGVWVV